MSQGTMGTVRVYAGVITRAYGASGNPPQGDPAQVKYDARAVNTPDGVPLINHQPKRRIASGVNVLAAQPGDPCTIVIVGREVFLHAYTEGIPFVEACP